MQRLADAGRLALAAALLTGLAAGGVGATDAAFFSTASNPSSSFTSAPDWVAPSSSRRIVAKATGCSPNTTGFVKPGGSYHVYAEIADTGNPASGTTSATTDVSSITAAETAAPLTAGSYTAGGTTYNYRSAALTAGAALAEGSKAYSLALTDAAANTRTETGYTVTIDGTASTAADVQATNDSGAVAGRPDQGDKLTLTFSEPIESCSVLADWNGGATSVTVKIVDGGAADTLQVWNSANTAQLPLGSIDLKGNTVLADASFSSSTMQQTGASITITLGTLTGSVETTATTDPIVWTPSTTPYDRAHNAASNAAATESGTADLDF